MTGFQIQIAWVNAYNDLTRVLFSNAEDQIMWLDMHGYDVMRSVHGVELTLAGTRLSFFAYGILDRTRLTQLEDTVKVNDIMLDVNELDRDTDYRVEDDRELVPDEMCLNRINVRINAR